MTNADPRSGGRGVHVQSFGDSGGRALEARVVSLELIDVEKPGVAVEHRQIERKARSAEIRFATACDSHVGVGPICRRRSSPVPDCSRDLMMLDTIEPVLEFGSLKEWPAARWRFTVAMAALSALAIGLPTDVIPNPVFGRQGTPVEPWAIPVLAMTAVLSGLLFATYFRIGGAGNAEDLDKPGRFGSLGGLLSFFAVGCPICNKLVVIALGTSGALTWFAPVQPYLGIFALGLLAWALRVRLRGEIACVVETAEPVL